MVKAEVKATSEKPPIGDGTQVFYKVKMVDDEQNATGDKGEIVVNFQDEGQRRSPRSGVFICLLILVLLVGFLVVYLIQRSKGESYEGLNFGDDYIVVTNSPDVSNRSSSAWHQNVSWETKEEFYTLSDAISKDDIMGLRPIFRKDLPRDYIAYWEAKIHDRKGERYVIISAARQTGDQRLAEEGPLPSPSDMLSNQARRHGHSCHRVYRLRPDGLMACVDSTTNAFVAATRDIDTDSWDVHWRTLDKQVNRALPSMKKEWDQRAESVRKDPEWVRFQWMSVETGELSTTTAPTKKTPTQTPTSPTTGFNFHPQATDDGLRAELGLRPGDSVRIPLGQGFREVRIKFVGFRDGQRKKTKNWKRRWQRRLCRVLCNVCEGEGYLDLTTVNKRFFKLTKIGDRFIKVQVDVDESFVRRHLEGHEIRFKVELRTRRSTVMVLNYGIILGSSRIRRSFSDKYFTLPREELLPRYRQHHYGKCMTGSGPVAWAKILGYYDNIAASALNSSYPSIGLLSGSSTPLPQTMSSAVQNMTQRIFHKLGSHCSPYGRGVTSPVQMLRIRKALGRRFKVVHRDRLDKDKNHWTGLVRRLLQNGHPVIVSRETNILEEHHYVIATRVRQSLKYYSFCNRQTDACSPWTLREESVLYVHEEDKPGKWESSDIQFLATVIEN
ncbi:uncharacterized protein [Montipora capricornis]|uniref:uncharacterized protein n=1 Tax=Montipora capricornis TaxID=246305 RepID=UPI0035F1F686